MAVDLADRRYVASLSADDEGATVTVAGWISDAKDLGKIGFLDLRDRTGTVQLVVKQDVGEDAFKAWLDVPRESAVAVAGRVQPTQKEKGGAAVELVVEELVVLNAAETPLPLGVVDAVEAELDTRLDNRFLDLRKDEVQAVFRVRDLVLEHAARFLRSEGFVEVHTPKIIASASEGGTALYPVQYFEQEAYLAQSPQLYKQMLMASGLDRVFEFAWYFRAEEHNTRRHLNESTAIDLEMAWIRDEGDVLDVLERLAQAVWRGVADDGAAWLQALDVEVPVPEVPFRRLTYDEVLEILAKEGSPLPWGQDLGTEHERVLGEAMAAEGEDFYFITRYPDAVKPFYAMPDPDDPEYSRSFDLDYRGVEITSGAQRVHDAAQLQQRLADQGLDPADFDHYLRAFRYGMPPHGGFGFGLERLVMNLLGLSNVREAVLFPRDRTRLVP